MTNDQPSCLKQTVKYTVGKLIIDNFEPNQFE